MDALAEAMERSLAAVPPRLYTRDAARARLTAVGTGYLEFALAEPGLFRTACAARGTPAQAAAAGDSGAPSGQNPCQPLVDAIDGLAAVGLLPADRRAHSEVVAWSAVHGLAELLLDGPLRGSTPADVAAMWARVGDAVLRGL